MGQEPPAVARDGDGEQWDLPCAACSITGRPLRAPPARRGHCSCSNSYLACRTACAPPACCPPPAPPRSPAPPLSFAPGARSFSFLDAPLCRHACFQPHECVPIAICAEAGRLTRPRGSRRREPAHFVHRHVGRHEHGRRVVDRLCEPDFPRNAVRSECTAIVLLRPLTQIGA
jgi:hypothetical protein